MNNLNANKIEQSAADLETKGQQNRAYPYPIDAIILAGTHQNASRLIDGRNKAFLEINGRILVQYVIDALLKAEHIDQIFVVGPALELLQAIPQLPARVHVIDQRGKMLTNCWAGIEASEDFHAHDPHVQVKERPMLITSCDIPLVTPQAIDDFVIRSAETDRQSGINNGMLVGVVDEPGVTPFYPEPGKPGVKRPYVEMAAGRLRLANIYVGRPRKLSEHEYLQTGFSHRKAKDWRNVIGLAYSFFRRPQGWQAAWMTARLQLTLMFSRNKGWFYRYLKKGNTTVRVERLISMVLGGDVKIIITPFGGLSLDVDDQEDYRVLEARYEDWVVITAATKGKISKLNTSVDD
jgi:GTP:adenosylcobinamide-phosphate guanylyltransferase